MTAQSRFIAELNNLMSPSLSGAFSEAMQELETYTTSQSLFRSKYLEQGAPSAKTVAVTLTAAELLSGIITATHTAGATAAYVVPTGTLLEAAVDSGIAVDEGFEWSLINLSAAAADTVTITAGTDHTLVGNAVVTSSHSTTIATSSARFFTRRTAEGVFVTYRIS